MDSRNFRDGFARSLPRMGKQRQKAFLRKVTIQEKYNSLPAIRFEQMLNAQKKEDRRLFADGQFEESANREEFDDHLASLHLKLRQIWTQRGIWDEAWDFNEAHDHTAITTSVDVESFGKRWFGRIESTGDLDFERAASQWRGKLGFRSKWKHEETDDYSQSRPLPQFNFEIAAYVEERCWRRFMLEARGYPQPADLNDSQGNKAHAFVKKQWQDWGIWRDCWKALPGMEWKHNVETDVLFRETWGPNTSTHRLLPHHDSESDSNHEGDDDQRGDDQGGAQSQRLTVVQVERSLSSQLEEPRDKTWLRQSEAGSSHVGPAFATSVESLLQNEPTIGASTALGNGLQRRRPPHPELASIFGGNRDTSRTQETVASSQPFMSAFGASAGPTNSGSSARNPRRRTGYTPSPRPFQGNPPPPQRNPPPPAEEPKRRQTRQDSRLARLPPQDRPVTSIEKDDDNGDLESDKGGDGDDSDDEDYDDGNGKSSTKKGQKPTIAPPPINPNPITGYFPRITNMANLFRGFGGSARRPNVPLPSVSNTQQGDKEKDKATEKNLTKDEEKEENEANPAVSPELPRVQNPTVAANRPLGRYRLPPPPAPPTTKDLKGKGNAQKEEEDDEIGDDDDDETLRLKRYRPTPLPGNRHHGPRSPDRGPGGAGPSSGTASGSGSGSNGGLSSSAAQGSNTIDTSGTQQGNAASSAGINANGKRAAQATPAGSPKKKAKATPKPKAAPKPRAPPKARASPKPKPKPKPSLQAPKTPVRRSARIQSKK